MMQQKFCNLDLAESEEVRPHRHRYRYRYRRELPLTRIKLADKNKTIKVY
jgi:hypothetical protein